MFLDERVVCGGRQAERTAPPTRRSSATRATSGASSTTRVSLTTVAASTAAASPCEAVATTWPTSCTDAPTHVPNSAPARPMRSAIAGRTKIDSVPQIVTSVIAYAVSSSSACTTPFTAAIADAPQIE